MKFLLIALFTVVLVACATQPGQPGFTKQQVGAVTGGVAGGYLGSQMFGGEPVAGAIGGAIIGTLVGGAIGQYMDQQDRINAQQAMIRTPVGQEAVWTNTNTGTSYVVRPTREYQEGQTYCREAQILINDGKEKAYTTVCRGSDGRWYVKP
ncbi:MAG: hypothetical protein AMJ43_02300 [Coxiella sp. DG_40]|nr:MAG: hypothetical protein AMJ43_02300 [Coxiella sp. DG_40]